MKKLFAILAMAALIQSCGPGKWVGGNQKHFDQRSAAKAKKPNETISIK